MLLNQVKHLLKAGILLLSTCLSINTVNAMSYDLDNGNAAIEIIIPRAIPAIFQTLSPSGGDAPLVLRATTLITNSWFDAIAPYHPTAVGVYSTLGRRPADESITNYNMNVAMIYSSYRVLNSLLPQHAQAWRDMVSSAGLDPDDDQQNTSTPIGIGNMAGNAIMVVREHDGMNQLGDEGGQKYNRKPYSNYTDYSPVNTAYKLKRPSRWQPAITTLGGGLFKVQQFVTAQLGTTLPYSYESNRRFAAPFPDDSQIWNLYKYKKQADDVLQASANMTDEQKMIAELFDNKINSLGFSALFASQVNGLSLAEFVQYDFLTNIAAFDTAIAIWKEKRRYDAVRPFSAIAFLYRDHPVTAWGGPGQGTVDDIPGSQWTSYLNVADHPEYPSASASFCAAHAQASRLYLGSDILGWSVPFPQGSSLIEPGLTPASDLTANWSTWSEFEHDCGQSRFWSGVHFPASIPAGQDIGHEIANIAFNFINQHINGNVN